MTEAHAFAWFAVNGALGVFAARLRRSVATHEGAFVGAEFAEVAQAALGARARAQPPRRLATSVANGVREGDTSHEKNSCYKKEAVHDEGSKGAHEMWPFLDISHFSSTDPRMKSRHKKPSVAFATRDPLTVLVDTLERGRLLPMIPDDAAIASPAWFDDARTGDKKTVELEILEIVASSIRGQSETVHDSKVRAAIDGLLGAMREASSLFPRPTPPSSHPRTK